MKLRKKGSTKFDHLCHTIIGAENNGVDYLGRNTGISCGKCGHELKSYYCEERLYMVECEHCGVKCLVQAGSPAQACYKTMAYPVNPVEQIDEDIGTRWRSSMTNKEAIKVLRLEGGLEISGNARRLAEFMEALDVAISALRRVEWEDSLWHDAKTDPPKTPGLYYGKKDDTNSMYAVNYRDGVWTLDCYPDHKIDILQWAEYAAFRRDEDE